MKAYKQVHKDQIKQGDTILFHGVERTVTGKDIKEGSFFGRSIFGDSFKNGHEKVTLIEFVVPNHTMRAIKVLFDDPSYNYITSVNGTDEELKEGFVGLVFNLGTVNDDLQKCINIEIIS